MQIDTLQLPIDWQKVQIHCEANRIGKRIFSAEQLPKDVPDYGRICQQCGRRQTHCPNFKLCESQSEMRERYSLYGPTCVIYLGFIKRNILFMAVCLLLFCVPLFVVNLLGTVCRNSATGCTSQDVIYYWSTYNVIGQSPGSLPHHIVWLVFAISMCGFTLYLRYYSMHAFRTINSKNTTDAEFALCLRRLPKGTTEQDIKDLLETQVAIEYDKVEHKQKNLIEELKKIKVKDIILIFQFHDILQVSEKNVKQFKKFVKEKEKGLHGQDEQFLPAPLPEVNQFANAVIVRFQDNRTKDLIMKTVKIKLVQKLLVAIFPFYNPLSQYKIRQRQISIMTAPEPNSIQWQNFGFSELSRIIRKIVSSLFTLILLVFSAGISIAISVGIQNLLQNTGIDPTSMTIILVIVSLLINVVIQLVVKLCIEHIRLDILDSQYCEELTVSVINQSINLGFFSIFAPIVAMLPAFIPVQTQSSSTFPSVMFTTIIFQSFIGVTIVFAVEYLQIVNRVFKFLFKKGVLIKTQTEAYDTFKGSQVPYVDCYTHLVKMVWFGFLYAVVSPICLFIAVIGLILYYTYQRALFNSKYSIPAYIGPRLNSTLVNLLDLTPFLVGLFNFFLYTTSMSTKKFEPESRIYGVIITTMVIGLINAIMPWKAILHHFYNEKQSDTIKEYDKDQINPTYQSCNPADQPQVEALMDQKTRQQVRQQGHHRQKVNIRQYINSVRRQQDGMDTGSCCKP